jgi:hypothetical protein
VKREKLVMSLVKVVLSILCVACGRRSISPRDRVTIETKAQKEEEEFES